MALVIWCFAETSAIRKVFGPVLGRSPVEHRIHSELSIPSLSAEDVLLVCGAKALDVLIKAGMAPKNRTVTSLRDGVLPSARQHIFVTFDPGIANKDYARLPDMQWDIQLAIRRIKTGSTRPKVGEYRFVDSLHELIETIDAKYEKTREKVRLASDLETKGLDEYNEDAWIIAASFTVEEGRSDVLYFDKGEAPVMPAIPWKGIEGCDYWEALWMQIHWLYTSEKIKLEGANFKYDSRWIYRKWGIDVSNLKFDTILVGSLLDENRSNSLKLHAKIYTDMGGYEDDMKKELTKLGIDMGSLEKLPKPKLLEYAGGDTDATYRVAIPLRKELLADKALTRFYAEILHPSSKVFEKMERTGVHLDLPYYRQLEQELDIEIGRLDEAMKSLIPSGLKAKYADNFSLTRAALLNDFLFTPAGLGLKPLVFTEKTGAPSTSMDHLMMFEDNPVAKEFIGLMRESNSARKTQSTFVKGFLSHLRSDGRFHPSYFLARGSFGGGDDSGTVTGRCVVASTLINTGRGAIPITEVIVGDVVWTHKNRWRKVTATYSNGVKPVVTVSAGTGAITCTENHPVMSFPSWKLPEDLNPGDIMYSVVQPPEVEVWSPVPDFPFEVSNFGRVRRSCDGQGVQRGDLVKQTAKGKWGHLRVTLSKYTSAGKYKDDFPVHRLVAGLFIGPPPSPEYEVSHKNGDASCNWVTNLEWVTPAENHFQMRLHGSYNKKSQQKLSWEIVDKIRAGDLGDDHAAAAFLDVSRELVRDIRLLKKWNGRRESMIGFQPVKVIEVVPAGIAETFDLTVEEDHSYVANGFVVHNTSASDPAIQTLPKHTKWAKRLRRAFTPPPGKAMLQIDYSQGELKITACVANEPVMIKAYGSGADLHAITAAQLNGYSFEEFMLLPEDLRDSLRSGGKAGNFGLIYGMQAAGFKDYAYTTYGVEMTENEAVSKREAFFNLYTKLPQWHEDSKQYARLHGMVRSPLGRIRHLPLIKSPDRESRSQAERQSVNSPIQSCLSDMMQFAMVLIDRQYGDSGSLEMCMMCHDACVFYVPEEDATIWAKRLKDIMDNLPLKKVFGWNHQLQFTTDAEVSVPGADGVASFATLKKLKNL